MIAIYILDKDSLRITSSLILSEENKQNSIISMKSIKSNDQEYTIFVGLYSTDIKVLTYTNNILSILRTITNSCSDLKPGISSIDYIEFTRPLEDSHTTILATGAFDYRFRLYNLTKNSYPAYLGSKSILNSSIIHKVKFISTEDQNTLYLFVASDQKLISIFQIE